MRFTSVFAAFAAFATFVAAQNNPITSPTGGSLQAGTPTTITWQPSDQGTITLVLRSGSSGALTTISTIASNIPNSGSYSWTPDSSLPPASDYTIQITSSANPNSANYSPRFAVAGGSASASGSSASGSTSASATGSTGSMTMTGSSSGSMPSFTMTGNSTVTASNSTTTTTASSNSTTSRTSSSSKATSSSSKTSSSASSTSSGASAPSSGAAVIVGSDGGFIAAAFALAGLAVLI